MVRGKCIYCREDKDLNKEHAFPKSLLHKYVPLRECAPEWIIKKLCEDCNNKALGKLDTILATRSAMAFIWRMIKNEWNREIKCQNSSFYNAKVHKIDPVRLFYPDPLYGNLIVLHEEAGTSVPFFQPAPLGYAQAPQMILTQYTEGDTREEIIAENCEKWDAGEFSITESDEHEGVYCLFGNTHIFPPKATKYFLTGLEQEQEFGSKFIKKRDHIRYDLNIIFPDDREDSGKLDGFFKRLRAGTKTQIEGENFEPKQFTPEIVIAADKKAQPFIDRAIAKIAFHCFLYHYPKFSGHESIFNDIKAYIEGKYDSHGETSREFVTTVGVPENYVYSSNKHFHIIRFYVHEDNITCQIVFFTGLLIEPFSDKTTEPFGSEITLAGNPDNARLSPYQEVSIPFYVHGKSHFKRNIVPVRF